jgi:hypothetical protein
MRHFQYMGESTQKIPYIDAILERDKKGKHYTDGALLLQDLLRYSLLINELPLRQSNPFKLQELRNWIVRNNKKIVDHYNKTLRHKRIKYSKRINDNKQVIDPRIELLLQLNLIRVIGTTMAEKVKLQISVFEYTKSGILLLLIIKSLNLKAVITITTRKDKIVELTKALQKIYEDIFNLLRLAFRTEKDSSGAVIFYSTLFQKCRDKGIFDKLVERMHYIINSESNIINATDLLQRAVYSAFFYKQSEAEFMGVLYETLEGLDRGVKRLILYRLKMFAENKFENQLEYLTRDYEEFRIEISGDYERIAVQGYCENCRTRQNVAVHYSDLRKISPQDSNDLRIDCSSCTTENSVIISNIYY